MSDKGTILVVDDDRTSLGLVANLLRIEGYEVRPADSGPIALASVGVRRPDLILLDIQMPGMNGFEIFRRLKANELSSGIPVIFLSASCEVEERVQGLRLGAVDYITKPYCREELLAHVQTHLELGRLRARLEREVAERTAELTRVNEQLQVELTERKRAELALRENEMRFRNLANRAPVGIWVTGPDRTVTFYNKRTLLFTGRRLEQLIQTGWAEIVHPDDLESVYSRYLPAVNARRSFRIECRVRRANGKYRWVLTTGIPISIKGSYAGHIGTSIDITDLKRSHNQMLATQKLETLGIMAAGIAHDFNNLLGGIVAESDLALSEMPEESPGHENVQHINAVAIRASEIVDLLMACAGGRDVSFEAVDLSKVVFEMVNLLKVSLPGNIVLDTRLDSALPAIRANPAQIRQVILNLIKNSKEALQDHDGTITITTGCVHTDCTSSDDGATDLPEGEYARLVVSDTGCGMSADVRAKVFDPFYTTKFTGRGLGLAVVQGVVRSHGGAIHVLSTPGRGSMFEVLLPYVNRRPKDKSSSSVTPERAPATVTILVVEDENALRLAVSKALEKNGFHVLAAETGEAAMELFRKHAEIVNLLLLDLNLPGISGAEVLLQARRIKPQVKIVITTGYDPQIIGASYAWGGQPPSSFIRKPYRVTELLQTIRKLLVAPPVETHAAA